MYIHIYKYQLFSLMKKKEILPLVTTWLNLRALH